MAVAAPAEAMALAKPLQTEGMLGAGLAYPREVVSPPGSLDTCGAHVIPDVEYTCSSKCLPQQLQSLPSLFDASAWTVSQQKAAFLKLLTSFCWIPTFLTSKSDPLYTRIFEQGTRTS